MSSSIDGSSEFRSTVSRINYEMKEREKKHNRREMVGIRSDERIVKELYSYLRNKFQKVEEDANESSQSKPKTPAMKDAVLFESTNLDSSSRSFYAASENAFL